MQIKYQMDENDFLTYQLYTASTSSMVRIKRMKNKVIVPVMYILFSLWFVYQKQYYVTLIFVAMSILWFIFYPVYERQRYVKHYLKFIRENYTKKFERLAHLSIDNDFIITHDEATETKVMTSEIEEINEIPQAVYIRLKTAQSYILPKNKITNIEEVIQELKSLASTLNIGYNTYPDWEWK